MPNSYSKSQYDKNQRGGAEEPPIKIYRKLTTENFEYAL